MSVYVGSVCIMGTTGTNAFLYWISIYLQYSHGCQRVPSLYVYVLGHGKVWVPRVPTHFCIKSPTECVYVWGVWIMGTTGTNTFLFVLNRRLNVCVCVYGVRVLWVPRVPTCFCIESQYICSTVIGTNGYQVSMCMCRAMTNYGYHGSQHVLV